jgi:ADP-heptose:LPS heptosyltransferase
MEHPYYREPMFLQKWRCLRDAGFAGPEQPEFHVTIAPALRRAAGIEPQDDGRYIHLSPFTSTERKELTREQTVEVVAALQAAFPQHRLVLSCAPTERERAKLADLLPRLPVRPWRSYAGQLNVGELTSVIQGAALHVGGDSAGLHLATLAGVPSVIWYREHGGRKEWTPPGDRHRLLVSDQGDDTALRGVTTAQIVAAARELLPVNPPRPAAAASPARAPHRPA